MFSKWLPQSIFYKIQAYIFHTQGHFACIETCLVFLCVANTIAIVNTCISIAGAQNRSLSKTLNSVFHPFSFFLAKRFIPQQLHHMIGRCGEFRAKTLHLRAPSAPSNRNSCTLQLTRKHEVSTSCHF